MGRGRYKFGESEYPHFLTCTVVGWLPVFTRPETVQSCRNSLQFLQDQNRMVLLGYVVLENHIHFIASAEDLPKEVGDFKSYTARRIVDYLSERHAPDSALMAWSITSSGTRATGRFNCGRKGATRRSSRPKR